jgi:hypothetical integral membrane protein (TIGR02206 family)
MFRAYSPSHLIVLAIFSAGTVVLLTVGQRLRGTRAEQPVAVAFAVANVVLGLTSMVLGMVPFDVRTSLPLQICGFVWAIVAWALVSRRATPTALTYYWGLTLTVQAMLQPTLQQAFPDPRFFVFWAKHLVIVWGAVYLTLTLRNGPDWQGYRRSVGWTFVWLCTVLGLNALLGANYGYVNRKPGSGSVLDVLGPWPVYLLAEVAIVVVGWALITLPWTGRPRRGSSRGAIS